MNELMTIYPFNLAKDIFAGDEEKAIEIYIPGIRSAIATLSEKEQGVLHCRYFNGMTLRKTGEVYGVTHERIRQIESKAIRKLRYPVRKAMFTAIPFESVKGERAEYYDLLQRYTNLEQAFTNKFALAAKEVDVLKTDIVELDLSVRAYNSLHRFGVNTLGDIISMTEAELRGIRNLGKKQAQEIMCMLEKYGYRLRDESEESK